VYTYINLGVISSSISVAETGSDTIFSSSVTALKRLSPHFVTFLKSLKVLHSSVELTEITRSGKRPGFVKREPVENEHPGQIPRLFPSTLFAHPFIVVRRHAVTGDEALFVNEQMTARLVGLKAEESGKAIVKNPDLYGG
jgi:sulfonate dioxygenase